VTHILDNNNILFNNWQPNATEFGMKTRYTIMWTLCRKRCIL